MTIVYVFDVYVSQQKQQNEQRNQNSHMPTQVFFLEIGETVFVKNKVLCGKTAGTGSSDFKLSLVTDNDKNIYNIRFIIIYKWVVK